jgi:hypothetical protein
MTGKWVFLIGPSLLSIPLLALLPIPISSGPHFWCFSVDISRDASLFFFPSPGS